MLGTCPGTVRIFPDRSAMAPSSSHDYAGDIGAQEAWDLLKANPKAQLIDVRTMAEWNFVGLPDISALGRRVHCIEWQTFPTMAVNPAFVTEAEAAVTALGAGKDTPILFLCPSGGRSRATAGGVAGQGFPPALQSGGGVAGG